MNKYFLYLIILLIVIFLSITVNNYVKRSPIQHAEEVKKENIDKSINQNFNKNLKKHPDLTIVNAEGDDNLVNTSTSGSNEKLTDTSIEEIESVFIIKGAGVDMKFLDAMKDGEIFNLSIESLAKAANNNNEAQLNRDYYKNLLERQALNQMKKNQTSSIDIDEIQCGISSCLGVMSASSQDDWKSFYDSFINNPENSIYTSNDVAFIDKNGNSFHRVFFSIDEKINAIVIPPKD